MFDNKDKLISVMRKPTLVSAMALDELEARLNGTAVVADVNSPFCFLLEFGSSLAANCINAVEEKLPVLYPQRAITMQDLYHHMSDYDYLRMYSTPATTNIRLMLPKKYLIDQALNYNVNYKKVTIPKDTVFTVGRFYFGLHYPIDILINNYTKTFTCLYDTTDHNPLLTLASNVVTKYDFTYQGIDYLVLDFPIYQFAKSIVEEAIVAEMGFVKKYAYNNNFYALRVWTIKDDQYIELKQEQSKTVYDATVPTLLLEVLPDEQKFKIQIPQIYFDRGDMGSRLYMEVYTTLGALDVNTANITADAIMANFALKSKDTTEFSYILKQLPFDLTMRLSSTKIAGGSDPVDLPTLRDRVVNDTLYEKAPITEREIAVLLQDSSFYLKKYRDNVTERIYYAYRVLEDGNGAIIPSITLRLQMRQTDWEDRSTVVKQIDNTFTILPTALFKYQEETDDVITIDDTELLAITGMDKVALKDTLNNTQYFQTPFHIRVELDDYYPQAVSFNLKCPEVQRLIFDTENYNVATKMMAFESKIDYLEQGVGGYRVQLAIYRSDDLKAVDPSLLPLWVCVRTSAGYWIGLQAQFQNVINDHLIYSFDIHTNYHLTLDNEIAITNFTNEHVTTAEHLISLTSDFHLCFMAHASVVSGAYEAAPQKVVEGVPTAWFDEHVGLVRQHLSIELGHRLDDVINNNVEVSTRARSYVTWDHNVPLLYTATEYERDPETGRLVTETDEDGHTRLVVKHEINEQVVDESGNLCWKHKIGDVKYDEYGEPEIALERDKVFYIDLMLIDAKVFASERTAELTFANTIPATLEGYFKTIRAVQQQLLERTKLFFRCVRSTGTAKFNMGDGVTSIQNIEMSFKIICYVPSYVKSDELIRAEITARTCDAIEEAIKTKEISMLDVFASVQSKLSDYIDHFTLLGINGDVANQTFTIISEDAQPSIARKLELNEDNILSLVKQIDIEFISLDDNAAESVQYSTTL